MWGWLAWPALSRQPEAVQGDPCFHMPTTHTTCTRSSHSDTTQLPLPCHAFQAYLPPAVDIRLLRPPHTHASLAIAALQPLTVL